MIYNFPGDLWLVHAMQGIGDWLTPIMKFFTWLGYPQAYMIVIAIIYWSVDRRLGLRMAIFLPVVSSLNSILKQAFHAPRPYWVDPEIKAIRVSNGFGMPSGHAQGATVWLYAGALLKRRWFWALTISVVLLVGLSRVYLGVHFFSQVLAGWLIGILVIVLFLRFEAGFLHWFLNQKIKWQILTIVGTTALFIIFGGIFVFMSGDWEMPAAWLTNALDDMAGKNESILYSIGLDAVAGNAGGFMGVVLGALFLHRKGEFEVGGKWWVVILRCIIGLLVIFSIFWLFNLIEPEHNREALGSIWRFGGFFLISFSALYLVPVLLMRIRLLKPQNN
jgi:membrane-associated phospholipid phosphatase